MIRLSVLVVVIVSTIFLFFQDTRSRAEHTINNFPIARRHVLYQGNLFDVSIDSVLYESPKSKYFFIKFFIKNKSLKKIGVELTERMQVIYPNQYGDYDTNFRSVIDEEQIIPDTLDKKKKDKLKRLYDTEELSMILPGKNLFYYCDFNNGGKKDIVSLKKRYVIISFDGLLNVTDGENFESVYCDGKTKVNRELVISTPVKWAVIPENSIVVSE